MATKERQTFRKELPCKLDREEKKGKGEGTDGNSGSK